MTSNSNDRHSHAVKMLAADDWLHQEPRAGAENETAHSGKAILLWISSSDDFSTLLATGIKNNVI